MTTWTQCINQSKYLSAPPPGQRSVEFNSGEEIIVLADAYGKKSVAAGFSIEEAIDALKPYLPKKGKSGAAYVVKYRDPANTGNTYGGRGKRPDWLRKYIDQGRKLEEFAV